MQNANVNTNVPNKAFDLEYMTEWGREVKFLKDHGINPTFIKKTPDYKIKQYKYKKTSDLFNALYVFYKDIENEKSYESVSKAFETGEKIELPEDVKTIADAIDYIRKLKFEDDTE